MLSKNDLLQWVKRFAPLKMVQEQNFSDGVCFSMILKAIHPQFPQLTIQTLTEYKIRNLEALKTAMVKHQINVDFDINRIARKDQDAALHFLSGLKAYYQSIRKQSIVKEAPPPIEPPQPNPCLIQLNPQLSSKKLNFVQGQPITYTPSSQSIPVQIQGNLSIYPSQSQFQPQPLSQFQERFATQPPIVSHQSFQPPTPVKPMQICTPFRQRYEINSQEEQVQRQITPIQSGRLTQLGTQSRHVQFADNLENQAPMPEYVFATPIQKKFKQQMQYMIGSSFGEGQVIQSNPMHDRVTPQFFQQLDSQSSALINEFNKMKTSNNKQVQKDSIRKIIKDIIMEGKGLSHANIQIQIIDAISGPEDQDLLRIKDWLLSQMQGQVMTQDQGTQYHSINSQGFYAQQSQLLPSQDYMEQFPQGYSSPSFAGLTQIQNQMHQQIASQTALSQPQSQHHQITGSQGSKSRQYY